MVCATSQIMSARSPCCRRSPLTSSQMLPVDGCPTSATGWMRPIGAACANDLPMSHGRFFSRMSFCRSRRVMSRPTAYPHTRSSARSARDLDAAAADRDHQLDLVMVVLRRQRVGDRADRRRDHRHHGVRRLGEEERRLLGRVAAHLLRVLGVVAADAVDVADGEARGAAGDRHARDVPRGEDGVHGGWLPRVGHSASGCRAGAASANAGSEVARGVDGEQRRVRREIGRHAPRVGELRDEADVGERGSVAVAVAPRGGFARELRLQRREADLAPVPVPRVAGGLVDAERAGQVLQHAQVVERVDVAGDGERDGAHARALRRGPRQQARLGMRLLQPLDDRERLGERPCRRRRPAAARGPAD